MSKKFTPLNTIIVSTNTKRWPSSRHSSNGRINCWGTSSRGHRSPCPRILQPTEEIITTTVAVDGVLSRFRFEIKYVKGVLNKVADCLSRYYSEDTPQDVHPKSEYVNADVRIDPDHDLLSWERIRELRQREIEERISRRTTSARPGRRNLPAGETTSPFWNHAPKARICMIYFINGRIHCLGERIIPEGPTAIEGPPHLDLKPRAEVVLCIPQGTLKDNTLTGIIIEQAHSIVGHFSSQKTSEYIAMVLVAENDEDDRDLLRLLRALQASQGELSASHWQATLATSPQHHGTASPCRKGTAEPMDVYDAIIERRVSNISPNTKRRDEPSINAGDMVYLSTSNLALPKGRASKLLPKYIGPYKVLQASPGPPITCWNCPSLKTWNLHPRFHVSKLRPHVPNDALLFPNRTPLTRTIGALR
ncbi:ribonuclease protein [Salix suchowensis]|nr:ribonuclease protein [Salix suchowensis]